MPKRKAAQVEVPEQELRRSTRRKSGTPQTATKRSAEEEPLKSKKARTDEDLRGGKDEEATSKPKAKPKVKPSSKDPTVNPKSKAAATKQKASSSVASKAEATDGASSSSSEKTYWLLKAEPESRIENGVDVKFSINDLASRTEPEPWDGIRSYVARNNLRAMKKGDLAFFYHSNCKEPGIVGTMEIVREHSPDLSAHDPKTPYYDASSKPGDPKWSVVHVEFRSKFAQPIELKELREMGKMGSPLESMQMLKQSRLSVSRVSEAEWEYLLGVVEERGGVTEKV
ncbi:PUA-like domain-containing protein [Xylariales sp. AK1849]|nr:PUA-like domain-containing protein [Xylariales sp. AK1849]